MPLPKYKVRRPKAHYWRFQLWRSERRQAVWKLSQRFCVRFPQISMSFMLIQHLDPKCHSILPELLSNATRIPVLKAIDAMKIESNRIYVMPSNVDISITDGHFGLKPRVIDRKQHLPIDIFMRSLAEARKSQAIGVILSGNASDGSAGSRWKWMGCPNPSNTHG